VTTLAGSTSGSSNAIGTNSQFCNPLGVSVSADGSFALVADYGNDRIRQLIIATGSVTTLAGSTSGSANGVGTSSQFRYPRGVSLSADDSIALIADDGNHLIRQATGMSPSLLPSAGPSESPSVDPTMTPSVALSELLLSLGPTVTSTWVLASRHLLVPPRRHLLVRVSRHLLFPASC
jgi:hypothetical protein